MNYTILPVANQLRCSNQKVDLEELVHFSSQGECPCSTVYLKSQYSMTQIESGWIRLIQRASLASTLGDEGYRLTIDIQGIRIEGASDRGIFYGIQSLIQILNQENAKLGQHDKITVQQCTILDRPRFGWRGFMLDSARHFHGPEVVKKILRAMASMKMNRFHWHLCDDQGWRIESTLYPELNRVGSHRKGSQAIDKKSYKAESHGGYFTKDEIGEILNLAHSLMIEVIPEIDIPGHSGAALAAIPELSCREEPMEVPRDFGILNHMICAGKDRSLQILDEIIEEAAGLFPGRYFHLGGDETKLAPWESCSHCRQRMEALGLESSGGLLRWFLDRQMKKLRSLGKIPILWNDARECTLEGFHTVQYWVEDQGGLAREVQNGRPVIISLHKQYYLDYPHSFISLMDCYGPVPLADQGSPNVLGIEAALWTEWVDSPERMDWQVFPRLAAVAESAWSDEIKKSWPEFLQRLEEFSSHLSDLGIQMKDPEPDIEKKVDPWNEPYEEQLRNVEEEFRRAHGIPASVEA